MEKIKVETEILDTIEDMEVIENPLIISLKTPYIFEGKEYKEIDLTGLEDIKTSDLIAVNKMVERAGGTSYMPEMTLEFACFLAAKATHKPIEFFQNLSPKTAMKIKNRVIGFLYGEE